MPMAFRGRGRPTHGEYFRQRSARQVRHATRRGIKRAVMAVARTMLTIAYTMLKTGRSYHELGGNYLEHINRDQLQRYFVNRLQKLELTVTVVPTA